MAQKYNGQIAGFPEKIVNRMLECQVEQGFPKNVSVFENSKQSRSVENGFDWKKTKEGYEFWYKVINLENFDHFFERYPKTTTSKYEIGKWYKTSAGSLVKYKNSDDNLFNASEHFMYDNLSELQTGGSFGSINNKFKEVSLEEIQQYLPDGHPDKIQKETISQFKEGEYIVQLTDTRSSFLFKNHVYLQKKDFETLYATQDEEGYETKSSYVFYSKPETWRYATSDEIAEYNRLEKPFDVTTLNKKSKEELLLEEANKRFPIGSKFTCQLGGFKNTRDEICIRKNELFYDSSTNSISAVDERYVYYKGEWATPVPEPSISNREYIDVISKCLLNNTDEKKSYKPLTPEECNFNKNEIKTHVIPTNVIDIQLKTKKKKHLFTI